MLPVATTIEAIMAKDFVNAKITVPDLRIEALAPGWALSLVKEVRLDLVSVGYHHVAFVIRRSTLQAKLLQALSRHLDLGDKAVIAGAGYLPHAK